MSVTRKQAQEARAAEFEGWKSQANVLGRHRILAVELVRTRDDRTAAVFTVFDKHHKPTQHVVYGDAQGRVDPEKHAEARIIGAAAPDDGDTAQNDMALGEPPPKEPPPPGIVAVGAGLLSVTFGTGELVPG